MRATFDNSYARLPGHFYARQHPDPVADPALVAVNAPLARELGIEPDSITAAVIAGNVDLVRVAERVVDLEHRRGRVVGPVGVDEQRPRGQVGGAPRGAP